MSLLRRLAADLRQHHWTGVAIELLIVYPKFDARRFPVLLGRLARQGLQPRPLRPEPYNCPPGSTSP